MMIIIGSFVVEAIAVAFFVWWRIFRRQPKRQQFGAWTAGGFVIGGGVDDHSPGSTHSGSGCGGGAGDHGSGCGGGGSCGGGGCGGGGGD
jgi:hypothetical protein